MRFIVGLIKFAIFVVLCWFAGAIFAYFLAWKIIQEVFEWLLRLVS